MIFIWGTKRSTRKIGFAADFCPICRQIRSFKVRAVRMVKHVYYVPLGRGTLVGHQSLCESCGVTLHTDENLPYRSTVKTAPADLEQLVFETYPGIRTDLAQRLQIEERIARRREPLESGIREQLLHEPFAILAPTVELRFAGTRFDRPTSFGCLATIAITIVFSGLGATFFYGSDGEEIMLDLAGAAFLIGSIYTIVRLAMAPGAFVRSEILPRLARALGPLQPTEDEIAACLARMRLMKLKIGKKVKVPAIVQAIADADQSVAVHPR